MPDPAPIVVDVDPNAVAARLSRRVATDARTIATLEEALDQAGAQIGALTEDRDRLQRLVDAFRLAPDAGQESDPPDDSATPLA